MSHGFIGKETLSESMLESWRRDSPRAASRAAIEGGNQAKRNA
jgi:hypothetical protein